jgi:nucleotide-binding universal stress UspA family protein
MKRFKKIVATTDLSPESLSTVRFAVHLATAQGASLAIVHVPESPAALYPEFEMPAKLDQLSAEMVRAARKKLEDWSRPYSKKLRLEVIVQRGPTHETICAVARELDADLIVMSTHGRHGFGRVFLGSVTNRVLREAPCPVLVVRPDIDAKKKAKPKSQTARPTARRK